MTDPTAQLAFLRAQRDAATDPAARAMFESLIATLEAAHPPSQHHQQIGGNAQVGVAVSGNLHGNVYLDGRRADQAARLLAGYLARLRGRCSSIPLEGVRQQKQVGDVLAISLDQVYTQLTVGGRAPREVFAGDALHRLNIKRYIKQHTGAELLPWQQRTALERPLTPAEREKQKQVTRKQVTRKLITPDIPFTANDVPVRDIIGERLEELDPDAFGKTMRKVDKVTFFGPKLVTDAIVDNRRLVLLGEPGSGKSTALRYLALMLAEAGLDQSVDLAARLAGWERLGSHGRLLPLFLPLLPFARRLSDQAERAGSADDLWGYIADQLEPGNVRTGLAEAVHAELAAGRALLLLDGLDEVAGAESRGRVVRAVRLFAEEHRQCRIVVTCRVRAYEGEQNREWQLPGWPTATLAEWDGPQMQHFIAAWYAAAVAAGGLPESQRADRAAALQRAVAASGDLQRLATRPLLLTIMALVHLNDGRLPEDRVTLYSRCIDILLGQWELRGKEQTVYGSLMSYIGLPDRDVQRLRPLLTRAAFSAHGAGCADSPGSLGRATLQMMAAEHLEQLGHPDPHRGARKFLEYTDVRAGLIQASDAGDAYVFPHLTFQEYLAGLELVRGVDFVPRIMERRGNDRWRVPILLGVGHLVSEGALAMPYQLLGELIASDGKADEQRQRDLVFAAEIAEDVGWDRLDQGGATFRQLRRDLARALAQVIEGRVLSVVDRVRAGRLLGRLGDPRPGVCTLPPAMVRIEGGSFVIGSNDQEIAQLKQVTEVWYCDPSDELNNHLVTVGTFEMARYQITNAQYALFIKEDGYNPIQYWWDDFGRAWLQKSKVTEPKYWSDEYFGYAHPNHPVVGVCWYEAVAFCRWLTNRSQYNPEGFTYLLPSEAEWEFAARGTERRVYPWGIDVPTDEHANFAQKNNGTTAVGCFSLGATPEGLLDLAGNVREWTRSEYLPYPYYEDDGREQLEIMHQKYFSRRGAAWDNNAISLRAAERRGDKADLRVDFVGFRLTRRLRRVE